MQAIVFQFELLKRDWAFDAALTLVCDHYRQRRLVSIDYTSTSLSADRPFGPLFR